MDIFNLVLALTGDPAATDTDGTGYFGILWILLMVAVVYFLMIRPQKKREKADRQLRASIQPGDSIVTIGGFVGRVLSVKDDEVVFETGADRTKLTVKKYAIQSRTQAETAAAKAESES